LFYHWTDSSTWFRNWLHAAKVFYYKYWRLMQTWLKAFRRVGEMSQRAWKDPVWNILLQNPLCENGGASRKKWVIHRNMRQQNILQLSSVLCCVCSEPVFYSCCIMGQASYDKGVVSLGIDESWVV
jgi:hypothetical protein